MDSLKNVTNILFEYSGFLIAGIIVALFWANLAPHDYHTLAHGSLHFLVNEIFMVIFFGIAAKEVTTALMVPGGALYDKKTAVSPLLGTLGGVLMPIGVYLALAFGLGHAELWKGFGVPTATDIAVAWLFARLIFGAKHPAVTFLLTLAIVDDAIGMGIIAIFYPDPHHPVELQWLTLTAVGIALAYVLRKKRVQNFWFYLAGPGVLSWLGLFLGHLHPALALVFIVPFMPGPAFEEGNFTDADDVLHDTLNEFEHFFKKLVELGLFFFALTNAGVTLTSDLSPVTYYVFSGLLIGKFLGIFGFTYLGKLVGIPYPEGMKTKDLFVVAFLGGIGLTVALFVSGVAFTDAHLQEAAKMGALLSVLAVVPAFILAKLLGVGTKKESTARTTGPLTPAID